MLDLQTHFAITKTFAMVFAKTFCKNHFANTAFEKRDDL